MRLAHIVPISLLDCVPIEQHTHLVLSELVLFEKRYSAFYAQRAQNGDFLILDNPVHEDRTVKIEQWLDAIKLIMPHVAVIPDVIDSSLMTIDNAREAVSAIAKRNFQSVKLMAVPHGVTQYDWIQCARELARIPEITWFGISLERRLNDDRAALFRRAQRVNYMRTYPEFARMRLHLLGLSESGIELSPTQPIWSRVTSVDASKFAVWNMVGYPVKPPVPIPLITPYPGRAPFGGSYEYFFASKPSGLSTRKMKNNLRLWNEYATKGI
jgi:hypothetical protein